MFVEERTPRGRCRQPARTRFGVLTGSGASPAAKAGLVHPQMPAREGLAGSQGAKWPGWSLAPKRACCVPWRGWEPSPGGLGAWSRINTGCSEPRPLRARPDQHIVQSGMHVYPHTRSRLGPTPARGTVLTRFTEDSKSENDKGTDTALATVPLSLGLTLGRMGVSPALRLGGGGVVPECHCLRSWRLGNVPSKTRVRLLWPSLPSRPLPR